MSVIAMPLISRGVPAFTNDDFSGAFPAAHADNANYLDYWRCQTVTVSGNSGALTQAVYLAYDLSGAAPLGHSAILWLNEPVTGAYNPALISNNYFNTPQGYTIDANAAAGGSLPGSGWVTLTTVTSSVYHSRQHSVDLTGYNWVRIRVTDITGSVSNNNAQLNMDVYSAPSGLTDAWIFYGDSITQRGFDHDSQTIGSGNVSMYINAVKPSYFPLMENGGIGGFLSGDGATNISTWLPLFPGKYVGLNYGTNDANNAAAGDPNFANDFTTHMTTMLTAVVGAGKIPVMPKTLPWGGTTNLLANVPILNTRLTSLFASFPTAIHGPDLYAFYNANQSLIGGDGIHPTDPDGYAAYRNLWANALLANVYSAQGQTLLHRRGLHVGSVQ
jgi:lysophospholipase L1-like esterase